MHQNLLIKDEILKNNAPGKKKVVMTDTVQSRKRLVTLVSKEMKPLLKTESGKRNQESTILEWRETKEIIEEKAP